jgi:hypothetical protein
MAERPKYELADVFQLIRVSKYWFSARSRSVNEVIRVYANSGSPKTTADAEKLILNALLTLTEKNFYQRNFQWEVILDIYGLIYDNRCWYVKFAVVDEEENGMTDLWLQEISFHPPKEGSVTLGGIKIKAEKNADET